MPAIQTYSELAKRLSSVRDLLGCIQSDLVNAHQLQTNLESNSVHPGIVYSTLAPLYDEMSDLTVEAARSLLAIYFEPEMSYIVGTPAAFNTSVITKSAAGATITDAITVPANVFGGIDTADTIEITEAEDAANKTTFAVDDTLTPFVLPLSFRKPTANAADTTLALTVRGKIPGIVQDTTKYANFQPTTNSKGSARDYQAGLNGTLVMLSRVDSSINELDALVVSKEPISIVDSISKAASAVVVTTTPHGFTTGDLVRFEGLSDAGYTVLNGRSFPIVVSDTTTFTLTDFDTSGFAAAISDRQGLVFKVNAPDSLHVLHKEDSFTTLGLTVRPGLRLRPDETLYIGIISDDASANCDITAILI